MDPTELERSLVSVFLEESGEGLERAEAGLLRLEADGSRELIDDLFRAVHSIKGGAGVVGMIELGPLAHAMESALIISFEARGTGTWVHQAAELRSQLWGPIGWLHELVVAVPAGWGVRAAVTGAKRAFEEGLR